MTHQLKASQNWKLSELSWLLAPSDDFSLRFNEISEKMKKNENAGQGIQKLASHRLNFNQLNRLGTLIRRCDRETLLPLENYRICVLCGGTTDFMAPALIASAARHGIALEITSTPYDQILQQALDPNSILNNSKPDAVLVALDHRSLKIEASIEKLNETSLDDTLKFISSIRDGIMNNGSPIMIIQTIPDVAESVFGNIELTINTQSNRIKFINEYIRNLTSDSGAVLYDVERMANLIGLDEWHDPVQWNMAKLPFAQKFLSLYAEKFANLLSMIRGRSRKCLVLDLDNTIWGGVIGDDGLDGLVLGNGSAVGEAFLEVQRAALTLKSRGVLLAVCSKNDEANARLPFRTHPEMLLKEDDISAFYANWRNKDINIQNIALDLNIGTDAIVFLDDNPFERYLVRHSLPEVSVPELPNDPSWYARTLLGAGYFESITFSNEDLNRTKFYKENVLRDKERGASKNFDLYLESLQSELTISKFDAISGNRVLQLINKTNQFNLTTIRLSEAEIQKFRNNSKYLTLQARLIDKYGDNGIISALVCRFENRNIYVDIWVMSCRVLGRLVEYEMMNAVVQLAITLGVDYIVGIYKPTSKNGMVKNLYREMGFKAVDSSLDGDAWRLSIDEHIIKKTYIKVKSFIEGHSRKSDNVDDSQK